MLPLLTCLSLLRFVCDGATINSHKPNLDGIAVQTETDGILSDTTTSLPKNPNEFLVDKVSPYETPPDKTNSDGAASTTASPDEYLSGKAIPHEAHSHHTHLDGSKENEAVFNKTHSDETSFDKTNFQKVPLNKMNAGLARFEVTNPDETCYIDEDLNEEHSTVPSFDKEYSCETNIDKAISNQHAAVSKKIHVDETNWKQLSSNEADSNETFAHDPNLDYMFSHEINIDETKLTIRALNKKEGAARVKATFDRAVTFTQNAAQKQTFENIARQVAARGQKSLDQFAQRPGSVRARAGFDRAISFAQNAAQKQNIEKFGQQLKLKGQKTLDQIARQNDPAFKTFMRCVSTFKYLKLPGRRGQNSDFSSETASVVFDDSPGSGWSSDSASSPERRRNGKERRPGSPEIGIQSGPPSPPPTLTPSPSNRYSRNSWQASPERTSSNNGPKIPMVDGEFIDKRGTLRTRNEWPIVYCKEYNINVHGYESYVQKFAKQFDPRKWENIFLYLSNKNMLSEESISVPIKADEEALLVAHSTDYLKSLTYKSTLVQITGIWLLNLFSYSLLEEHLLEPTRYQAGGSILAGELAIHRGWAINLGGGFNHASKSQGVGFCAYADISLIIKWLFKFYPDRVKSAMIVDLSAAQGRGFETDFAGDGRIFMVDIYSTSSPDQDPIAKRAAQYRLELECGTITAEEYLELIERCLENNLITTTRPIPDILVYNAGTDIIQGDPCGLGFSAEAIIARDQIVFTKAKEKGVPIAMVTGGGFLFESASVVARSILNLVNQGIISK